MGRSLLPESKAWEIVAQACQISSRSVISTCITVHDFSQLGLRSHPTGSSTSEATARTISFFRSDKPVYTTASVKPIGRCQPTLSYLGNSHPTFPGRLYNIFGRLCTEMGRQPMGDSQISGTWTLTDRKRHINCLEPYTTGLQCFRTTRL